MNESDGKKVKAKRVSKLAVASFWTSIAVLILFMARFILLFWVSLGIALICGVVALIQILMSGGKLGGVKYSIFGVTVCVLYIAFLLLLFSLMGRKLAPDCCYHLRYVSICMKMYSGDNNEKYPTANKWCDLLDPYYENGKIFICPSGKKANSHYAINPNARPNSPKDTVLLFETTGGWNQFGGAELITAKNHNGKGCNVGYITGQVEFVRKEDFGKLNWGEAK